jgi:hypothetical protein
MHEKGSAIQKVFPALFSASAGKSVRKASTAICASLTAEEIIVILPMGQQLHNYVNRM